MKPNLGSALLGLAVFVVAPLALKAGDPGPSFAFKLRGLLAAPPSDAGLTNNTFAGNMGFGAGFGVEMGLDAGKGQFKAELGYSVLPGDEYLTNVGNQAIQPVPGSTVKVNMATSVESRKNKLEGMLLRLGYEGVCTPTISWRAGLQFGGNKFTHQVLGNVNGTIDTPQPQNPAPAPPVPDKVVPFTDSYHYVGSKSSMAPSPYVGGTWKFDESSALEFGVLFLQYSDLTYIHVANSQNQYDTIPSRNRVEANLEVAYVFRF